MKGEIKRKQLPRTYEIELPYDLSNYKCILNNYKNEAKAKKIALNKISEVGIFIGPEGGIEEDEILKLKEIGAHIVTLGNRILRTETAGFTAASLIQYELGDLGGVI